MTLQEYYDVKSFIEREYRYNCLESSFRWDAEYEPVRAKYRALHKQICEWENKTLEKALSGIDVSFFREV